MDNKIIDFSSFSEDIERISNKYSSILDIPIYEFLVFFKDAKNSIEVDGLKIYTIDYLISTRREILIDNFKKHNCNGGDITQNFGIINISFSSLNRYLIIPNDFKKILSIYHLNVLRKNICSVIKYIASIKNISEKQLFEKYNKLIPVDCDEVKKQRLLQSSLGEVFVEYSEYLKCNIPCHFVSGFRDCGIITLKDLFCFYQPSIVDTLTDIREIIEKVCEEKKILCNCSIDKMVFQIYELFRSYEMLFIDREVLPDVIAALNCYKSEREKQQESYKRFDMIIDQLVSML